jgi:hypothetical protein
MTEITREMRDARKILRQGERYGTGPTTFLEAMNRRFTPEIEARYAAVHWAEDLLLRSSTIPNRYAIYFNSDAERTKDYVLMLRECHSKAVFETANWWG